MIRDLDAMQQRRLANGLLAGLIVVLISITAVPLWLLNKSYRSDLDQLNRQLQTYQRVASRDSDLLPRFEQLKQAQLNDGHYLKSETVAVAGAELQRLVKDIAGANQSQILSTQILPAAREQGFVQVAIKVRMRGSLPGMLQAFHAMESSNVFLFLDNVSIRESTAGRRPRQTAVKQMDADFDLVAYMADMS